MFSCFVNLKWVIFKFDTSTSRSVPNKVYGVDGGKNTPLKTFISTFIMSPHAKKLFVK